VEFWPTVGVVVLTAVLTWIGHTVLASQQRRLDVLKALEQRKRELYAQFLRIFFEILQKSRSKNFDVSKYEKAFMELTRDMTVYASDRVLKLFGQFRKLAIEGQKDPKVAVKWLGEIIMEIRRDLGYSTTQVKPEDILRTFIVDIDTLLEK
jgi:hypothetical protein